jgi:lipoprotein-anchoring transpeptidase ErfK/SrfK
MDPASGRVIREYPMSPGGPGHETPTGSFEITEITEKPWWYPPSSPWAAGAKPTPPGPRNPLGPMKMRVGSSSVLFHGVPISKFDSLGKYAASHGCLRMFPQDAWELHRIVSKGTRVEIIPGK